LRLAHYRNALAAAAAKKPEVVLKHTLDQNDERLKLRYHLERQLQGLTGRAEAAMSRHGIAENAERLKAHYHLDRPVDTAVILVEKALAHHRIEENIERLKLRYAGAPQRLMAVARAEPMTALSHHELEISPPRAKSSAGLYRDKVSWANYIKESLEGILRERQPRPVPVTVGVYSGADLPRSAQDHDLPGWRRNCGPRTRLY
jgi:hypothetical protein